MDHLFSALYEFSKDVGRGNCERCKSYSFTKAVGAGLLSDCGGYLWVFHAAFFLAGSQFDKLFNDRAGWGDLLLYGSGEPS